MPLIPISCRFVPYDQWFFTHLDDASKIKHVKHWLLSKSNLVHTPPPLLSRRSVSPITFAPSVRSRSSRDSLDDGYNEDDESSDHDLLVPILSPAPAQKHPPPPLLDQYTLLSFSTGAILEDEFLLSWYNLRPYELVEIHPVGTIAPLHRDVLADYIQPYFQAKARLLRAVWNHKSGRFEAPAFDPSKPDPKSAKRKPKVDWKARWVVINQGILSLCKGHVTSPPHRQFPLYNMKALRGTEALERAYSIVVEPRIICIKFCSRRSSITGVASPPPSLPSSPIFDRPRTQEPFIESGDDPNDPGDAQADWIVLDMLDDHAFSSILRILHRQASYPVSSSFVPSSSIIAVSHSSPVMPQFTPYDPIPYPEWRMHTVENARKAGMGDVGKPMAWVIWTEKGLGESLMGNIRYHRQAFSQAMQYKTGFISSCMYSGDESDDESEMEWEGWMRDLGRQNRVKQREDMASVTSTSTEVQRPSASSSALPSPPLSETSPTGSPRPSSPSLSHIQYPNIGNIIHGSRSVEPKSMIVSTVSVGTAPLTRRRSSTFTLDKQPFPCMPVPGSRTNARTLSTSASLPRSTRTVVRQVHSSSNLRISSYASDALESAPGPSSPSKRQSTFMRRAGKIVRGLESAIDFVDDR